MKALTPAVLVVLGLTLPAAGAFDVTEKTIGDLQAAMQDHVVTSAALVEQYLARIQAYDRTGPRLNAIIAVNPRAREEAAALDRERASQGPRGPLHGIPLVIKDNFDLAGMSNCTGNFNRDGSDVSRSCFHSSASESQYSISFSASAARSRHIFSKVANLFREYIIAPLS